MNKKIAQDEVKAQDRSVKMGVFDKFLDIMKLNDDEYEDDEYEDEPAARGKTKNIKSRKKGGSKADDEEDYEMDFIDL